MSPITVPLPVTGLKCRIHGPVRTRSDVALSTTLAVLAAGSAGRLPAQGRVANVAEFTDAISRVAAGGTALDPEVVAGLLNASRHALALGALTAREHDVLALSVALTCFGGSMEV